MIDSAVTQGGPKKPLLGWKVKEEILKNYKKIKPCSQNQNQTQNQTNPPKNPNNNKKRKPKKLKKPKEATNVNVY